MINKEIILNADGSIKKDFSDRAIPQNSNNQVSVNVLIPSTCFVGLQNYAVLLAVSRIIGNSETTLNSLVMSVSKSITIDGVVYVKYTAYLSSAYTDKLGQLKFSPYIQTTATITEDDETSEVISIQQSFTNSNLNVIKSVLPQYDASLEDSTIATTLETQINSKKIYTFIDDATSVGEHYYNLADGFNPTVDQFNGCLVMSVYGGWTNAYIPYLNNGNVELLEIIKTGMFYKISDVSYDSGTSTYTYTRTKLSYSKSEIDTIETNLQNQINGKVDKTQKVNGHALSGDVDVTKGDVGLGNVVNYGVETTPTAVGDNLYITSKGVYDALQTIYGIINGLATESQITTINGRLDSIEALLGDGTDDDNIINTLYEVVQTLSGLGEDANILSMINSKVSQSDFDTLNSQINGTNGIATKVSFLYDSNANAYAEITGGNDAINVLVGDWVENTGDTNYPYKWELSNGYLVGASYVSVVFDKDSDTSMLSATIGIDDENGKVILYASELPSDIIQIQKIAIFNSANAYILYNQTLVSQVTSNTNAISDINNVKLPQYLKKQNESGEYNVIFQSENNGVDTIDGSIQAIHFEDNDNFENAGIHATPHKAIFQAIKMVSGVATNHELSFDNNGKLIRDNTHYIEVKGCYTTTTQPTLVGGGLYRISTADVSKIGNEEFTSGRLLFYKDNSGNIQEIYNTISQAVTEDGGVNYLNLQRVGVISSGGGSQLYQHNIWIRNTGYSVNLILMIINYDNSPINTDSKLKAFLSSSLHPCSGYLSGYDTIGLYVQSDNIYGWLANGSGSNTLASYNDVSYTDNIITL